jgi:hypothetical protein
VLLTASAPWQHDWRSLARACIGAVALFGFYLLLVLVYPAGMGWGAVKLAGLLGGVLAYLSWSASTDRRLRPGCGGRGCGQGKRPGTRSADPRQASSRARGTVSPNLTTRHGLWRLLTRFLPTPRLVLPTPRLANQGRPRPIHRRLGKPGESAGS